MRIIKFDSDLIFDEVMEVLNSGGVIMHPTETCYGLAVDILNKAALDKLYRVKEMAFSKPVSILVGSLDMAQNYGVFSGKALELAKKYWPGPLSIVVPRTVKLPSFFNPEEKFVSIRFSNNEFCQKMVSSFGKPVTTTSANLSGEYQLYGTDIISLRDLDLIVDAGDIPENRPSTIVKIDNDEVEVLRQGDLRL